MKPALRKPGLAASSDRLSLEVGKLPTMRVIEMDSLLLHEDPDPQRQKSLTRRMASDDCLRNPPIAARDHGSASHILLDGANRVEALRHLGARFVLIQEVDLSDEHLVLSTWHHAVEGLPGEEIVKKLASFTKVKTFKGRFTPDGDFVPEFADDVACCIVLPDRRTRAVLGASPAGRQVEVAQRVVAITRAASNRDRVSYTNMRDLAGNYPHFSALICYKGFSKQEVLRLALAGTRFPSGVTRFSVPKRALSLRVPLRFLKRRNSLEQKQTELQEMIRSAIEAKRIRFYEEPTFYFDD
jgi:hypothetical protein